MAFWLSHGLNLLTNGDTRNSQKVLISHWRSSVCPTTQLLRRGVDNRAGVLAISWGIVCAGDALVAGRKLPISWPQLFTGSLPLPEAQSQSVAPQISYGRTQACATDKR